VNSRKYDPTGKLDELALAHENDSKLPGRGGQGRTWITQRVVYVETISHNHYLRYVTAFTTPFGNQIVHLRGSTRGTQREPRAMESRL